MIGGEKTARNEIGYLRIGEVLKIIPVGKSTWWQGIKEGKYPAPVKISKRISAWKATDIRDLYDRLNEYI